MWVFALAAAFGTIQKGRLSALRGKWPKCLYGMGVVWNLLGRQGGLKIPKIVRTLCMEDHLGSGHLSPHCSNETTSYCLSPSVSLRHLPLILPRDNGGLPNLI